MELLGTGIIIATKACFWSSWCIVTVKHFAESTKTQEAGSQDAHIQKRKALRFHACASRVPTSHVPANSAQCLTAITATTVNEKLQAPVMWNEQCVMCPNLTSFTQEQRYSFQNNLWGSDVMRRIRIHLFSMENKNTGNGRLQHKKPTGPRQNWHLAYPSPKTTCLTSIE